MKRYLVLFPLLLCLLKAEAYEPRTMGAEEEIQSMRDYPSPKEKTSWLKVLLIIVIGVGISGGVVYNRKKRSVSTPDNSKIDMGDEMQLRAELVKLIHSPHSEIITDTILGHFRCKGIESERLLMAIKGSVPNVQYKIGDVVQVPMPCIKQWRYYEQKMLAAGKLHRGSFFATVNDTDKFRINRIQIELLEVEEQGIRKMHYTWVDEAEICLKEDAYKV